MARNFPAITMFSNLTCCQQSQKLSILLIYHTDCRLMIIFLYATAKEQVFYFALRKELEVSFGST